MVEEMMKMLGFGGHVTEFAGLAPHQQTMLEQARSTWESLGADPTAVIGQPKGAKLVPFYFAAIDTTGAKAQEMGLANQPVIAFLGEKVEQGQTPGPVMFTVESKISARTAVVYVMYKEADPWSGYGNLYNAVWLVDSICDTFDQAAARVLEFQQATRVLKQAVVAIERAEARANAKNDDGPAF